MGTNFKSQRVFLYFISVGSHGLGFRPCLRQDSLATDVRRSSLDVTFTIKAQSLVSVT